MARTNAAQKLLGEVVSYGGFPLRRIDVYRDVRERLDGDKRTADLIAFGCLNAIDAVPIGYAEFLREITPEEHS